MKPLKILLGNNTLSLLAGSETWTYTLALALKEAGHDVSCYSPQLGIVSDELVKAGIPCFDTIDTGSGIRAFTFILEEKVDHNYDVIIANHNHVVDFLRSQFPKTPIISTIHGTMHIQDGQMAPEHPALESGVNQFVAVSEEINTLLQAKYGVDSVIIRNFFDVKKWKALKPANVGSINQILVNTNYMSKENPVIQLIRDAAKSIGAKVAAVGESFSQSFDLSKAIEDSDVVIGMGRSVLEGVAAGRLGIVLGRWGFGGVITEGSYKDIREFNFSGRNAPNKDLPTVEELADLFLKNYRPGTLEWGMQYIARDHNAVFAAEEYVRIARMLTGETMSRPARAGGVDPEARPFKLQKYASDNS